MKRRTPIIISVNDVIWKIDFTKFPSLLWLKAWWNQFMPLYFSALAFSLLSPPAYNHYLSKVRPSKRSNITLQHRVTRARLLKRSASSQQAWKRFSKVFMENNIPFHSCFPWFFLNFCFTNPSNHFPPSNLQFQTDFLSDGYSILVLLCRMQFRFNHPFMKFFYSFFYMSCIGIWHFSPSKSTIL